MSLLHTQTNELEVINDQYIKKVEDSVLAVESKQSMSPHELELFNEKLRKKIDLDINRLSETTDRILEENEYISNQDVIIELLKNISVHNKSKFMRKIATEMLKERWWDK